MLRLLSGVASHHSPIARGVGRRWTGEVVLGDRHIAREDGGYESSPSDSAMITRFLNARGLHRRVYPYGIAYRMLSGITTL